MDNKNYSLQTSILGAILLAGLLKTGEAYPLRWGSRSFSWSARTARSSLFLGLTALASLKRTYATEAPLWGSKGSPERIVIHRIPGQPMPIIFSDPATGGNVTTIQIPSLTTTSPHPTAIEPHDSAFKPKATVTEEATQTTTWMDENKKYGTSGLLWSYIYNPVVIITTRDVPHEPLSSRVELPLPSRCTALRSTDATGTSSLRIQCPQVTIQIQEHADHPFSVAVMGDAT